MGEDISLVPADVSNSAMSILYFYNSGNFNSVEFSKAGCKLQTHWQHIRIECPQSSGSQQILFIECGQAQIGIEFKMMHGTIYY